VPQTPRHSVVIVPRQRGRRLPPAALPVPPPVVAPCSAAQVLGAPPFVAPQAMPSPVPARPPMPVAPKPPRRPGP
jgi:hypothetical protein